MRTGLVDEFAGDLAVDVLWKRTCTGTEWRFNMSPTIKDLAKGTSISEVMIPDSKLARETTELVHDTGLRRCSPMPKRLAPELASPRPKQPMLRSQAQKDLSSTESLF